MQGSRWASLVGGVVSQPVGIFLPPITASIEGPATPQGSEAISSEGAGLEVEITLNGYDAVQANRFKFVEGDIPLFFLLHNLMFIRWVCRVSDC